MKVLLARNSSTNIDSCRVNFLRQKKNQFGSVCMFIKHDLLKVKSLSYKFKEKLINLMETFSNRRAGACILLYYMASAVEFFTTKVGCSTFKALWSLSIGPALGMCLFTKISYKNKAPAGWVNKNHQLKPYSIAIYTLPHVCFQMSSTCKYLIVIPANICNDMENILT